LRGVPRPFLGHNPLGGLIVVVLLGLVGTIGTLGLFALEENDLATGPLYRYAGEAWAKVATSWHRFLFEPVLLILAAIHIAANVFYSVFKRDPLITAMITGQKPDATYEDIDLARPIAHPIRRALVLLAIAASIVFGGIVAVGGKLP
jgi:cytochrome b